MKKNYFLLLLFISPYIKSEIAFTQIKGLYEPIAQAKKQCSPTHGFNWWKLGIIENLYRFGDQESATIKLIRELFYLQPDGITFDVTNLARKPAKYFDAKTIGEIVMILDRYTKPLSDSEQALLTKQLLDTLTRSLNFDKQVAQSQQHIADAKQKIAQLGGLGQERTALQKKIITSERLLKQLVGLTQPDPNKAVQTAARIEQTKKDIASTNQQLDSIKQRLDQRKDLDRIIHNNDLQQESLTMVVNYLVASLQETLQEKYAPYTTHQILLSFLWKKLNDKKQFLDYFAVAIPEMKIGNQAAWLDEQYTKEEFERCKRTLVGNPDYATSDYPLNSFVGFSRRVWDASGLPLLISSISDATYRIGDNEYRFPDCGETSLRNFFHIIIYDSIGGVLNLSRLTKSAQTNGFTLNPVLSAYFKTYHDIAKIQTKPYYDAWTQVVSGLSGVEYLNQAGYEISPKKGLSNMLKVINHLLFNNSSEFEQMTNKQKLDYLVGKVSRPDFTLTWQAKRHKNDNTTITDTTSVDVNREDTEIEIVFTINQKTDFSWMFSDNHFVLYAEHKTAPDHNAIVGTLASKTVTEPTQRMNNINLLGWYTTTKTLPSVIALLSTPISLSTSNEIWDEQAEEWVTQEAPEQKPTISSAVLNNYYLVIALALDLHNHQVVISVLSWLLGVPQLATQYQQIIQNLIDSLPIKDHFYADKVGLIITTKKAASWYPLLREIPVGTSTIRGIIEAANQELYDLVQKNIQDAYDNWPQNKSKDHYLEIVTLKEFENIPGGLAIRKKFEPLLQIRAWEKTLWEAVLTIKSPQHYAQIKKDITKLTSQPLTPQQDAQLGELLDVVLHPDEDIDEVTPFFDIIIPIIKATNYKPNIVHVAKHALEEKLEPLYEPLRQAILRNPAFDNVVLEILKNKVPQLYTTVQEVAARSKDKTLLDSIKENIRTYTIQELYPLANDIEQRIKKEEQVTLTLPGLYNSIVQFAQSLFGHVTKGAFKS